ncbi:hypothetical protein KQY30_19980 [Streptomyces sp. GMY02]|uniref:hypothetical protein n=1 Tax=Streptomyces sp. GMY02 TaxID=1333528 RepID=UPI001C2C85C6|nr:hypothetical protein [Streptomyces sp. GMY02]QXE36180.1 hypothetical protein KQY30_19980 [Streptomyces sp. GMY02]
MSETTTTATAGVPTPGRPAGGGRIEGALFVDLDGQRARYECLRPGCPHRREGPVFSTDLDEDGEPIGVGGVKAFIDGIKTQHLTQHHHGENR